jgi:hypothetical protein
LAIRAPRCLVVLWVRPALGGARNGPGAAGQALAGCTPPPGRAAARTALSDLLDVLVLCDRRTGRRRVYQRAIAVPTHSLELLWKQYETFENGQVSCMS